MGITLSDVRVNCGNQLWDTAKDPAPNLFSGQVSNHAFDQIEPRTTGGREMHVDARVAPQPPLDRGVFMRGIIVGDQSGSSPEGLDDQSDEGTSAIPDADGVASRWR